MSFQIIGITGRSGSGKSSLTEYYASLGYPTMDGDAVSREIMVAGSPCTDQLAERFGAGILLPDGGVNRKALGEIVYADADANQALVEITHPHILNTMLHRAGEAERAGNALFFVDGAMIVGGPFEERCDAIVLVVAELRLSVSRIVLRDKISKTAAMQRLRAQPSEERLRAAADYVIENNAGVDVLHRQANLTLHSILQRKGAADEQG